MFETTSQLLSALIKSLSSGLSINAVTDEYVRFSWRSTSYQVRLNGSVEERQPGVLVSSDKAWLISQLLKLNKHE